MTDDSIESDRLREAFTQAATIRRINVAARDEGLDPTTWQVLLAVALEDTSAIAELGLPDQAVRRSLAALHGDKLVKTHRDRKDKRRKRYAATPSGRRMLHRLLGDPPPEGRHRGTGDPPG